MSRRKKNGPRAVAAARKAKIVASRKPTGPHSPKAPLEASAYARTWVARRYRAETRWAGLIAEAAGLGGQR